MSWQFSDVDDDGRSPEVTVTEGGVESQALYVRVGKVFTGGNEEGPGIWISYQNRHQQSEIQGPVLITEQTWNELNTAVQTRLRRHKRGIRAWFTRVMS